MMFKQKIQRKRWILKVSQRGKYYLRRAPLALRRDRQVVLTACNENGHALQYAAEALKDDVEVAFSYK
eukprot:5725356-Amphidinium_carterae.1